MRSQCRPCYNAYHSARRKTKKHKDYIRRKKEDLREMVDELKSVPCADCGQSFPPYCMDFDHLENKEYEVACLVGSGFSKKRILEEVAKCEVVCAVCHRMRTFAEEHGSEALK